MIDLDKLDRDREVSDLEFQTLVQSMPQVYWSRNDLSAVRLGWEMRRQTEENASNNTKAA